MQITQACLQLLRVGAHLGRPEGLRGGVGLRRDRDQRHVRHPRRPRDDRHDQEEPRPCPSLLLRSGLLPLLLGGKDRHDGNVRRRLHSVKRGRVEVDDSCLLSLSLSPRTRLLLPCF